MNLFIRKLHIENFKTFQNIVITLNKLTVLAGANSVGKSTIIQSLLLSRALYDAQLQEGEKLAINDIYLMQLGFNNQITNSNFISFKYAFENSTTLNIMFKPYPDKNYLELDSLNSNPEQSLFAPNFHYLNAERIGPRPSYGSRVSQLPTTGYQGEYTIELLTNGQLFDISEDKNFHNNTNTAGESLNTLSQQTELWMNFIIPDIQITANKIMEVNRTVALFNQHTAPNVGFGVSYVLPIVVSGLIAEENSILIVENPEAHLHPYGQSKIGQFLAMVAASGVQVIVETHSEHVINGIRIASLKKNIQYNDIVINFFNKSKYNITEVKEIQISNKGELSEWPEGFFDQEEQDLSEMFKLTHRK